VLAFSFARTVYALNNWETSEQKQINKSRRCPQKSNNKRVMSVGYE